MTSTDNTRKRKGEFVEPKPINTSWTDYVYSSPNSPQQQQDYDHILNQVNNERRHSVSVAEMNFHSFDKLNWNSNELALSGGNSLPSSWSSSSSDHPMIHRRAMSLRLDNLPLQQSDMHRASISTASPTTPAFFSPSFLDALKHEDDMMDTSFEHPLTDDLIQNFMMNQQSTITPSVINTGEVNNLTNWLLNQSSPTKRSASPPASPIYQKQHPSIPEEEDEDMMELDKNRIKQLDIPSRIAVQGSNSDAIMKPLVQKYLSTFQDERKIMIHTSKVAQKSYGTEKRYKKKRNENKT